MFAYSILIFVLLVVVKSAKILIVVPTPSISHQVVFRPLIKELINYHEVTVITPNPVYSPEKSSNNLTEIDLHNMSYTLWNEWFRETGKIDANDFLSKMTVAFRLLSEVFEEQLKEKTVQDLIEDKTVKFDLLILEACVTPALIFSHIFEAPVIQMSSFGAHPGNMEMIGALTHSFLYPIQYHRRIYNLTIFDKINELYKEILMYQMLKRQEFEDDKMLKRLFGNTVPLLSELRNNVHMLFLNVHPIWSHNQPVPPGVVYTWGIHKTPEKPLPEDLRSYLDSSERGVIYVSFGTNINTSSIPAETLTILLKVFSRLPYNVLWKWDTEELLGKSDNIKISKWLPQVDVLRHPNLKLFITQGGLQSTDEAIDAGVPLIGIPMIADQDYNAEKYEHFKIGIKLGIKTLTFEQLDNAIKSMFREHDSYKKNIIKLRTQMQDLPKPPLENAVWWIEYVLRHGGAKHLRTPAANMSYTEYYELEFIITVLCGLMILVTSLFLLIYTCFKRILNIIYLKSNKIKVS